MGTRTNFICRKCGRYEVAHRKGKRICKQCEGVYIKAWKERTGKQKDYNKKIAEKRLKIKELCVEYLGGKCQYEPQCYSPTIDGVSPCVMIFHFHHVDPSTKKFDFSRRLRNGGSIKATSSLEALKEKDPELIEELDKCILLCANCHHRIEYCDTCSREESAA